MSGGRREGRPFATARGSEIRTLAAVGKRAVLGALACAALLLPAALRAQEPRTITFEDAVQRALVRSTDVLRAQAQLGASGAVETREKMDFLPELSLSTRGTRSFGRSFSQAEGAILSESNDIVDAGLSVSMSLFDGLENFASLRQASLREDANRLRLDRAREDAVFAVVEGFTNLIEARELAAVREEELTAANELLAQVRRLVEVGRRPVSDLYQQEAVQAEAEASLVEARQQAGLAETLLIQALQLDPLGEYDFVAPALPEEPPPAVDYRLEELLDLALARRSDLEAAERDYEASDQGVTVARSGYFPSLSLSFNYGSNWSSNSLQPVPGTGTDPRVVSITPDGGGEPVMFEVPGTGTDPLFVRPGFLDQMDGRRGGSVSLSVSIPVFSGWQTKASVAQAEAGRLTARYDLQDQRQQVALQVRQALLDYESAVARQEATARRRRAAERAWQAAERRYELGAATFVEVVQARSAIRARFAVLLAQRLIEYHTGGLDAQSAALTDLQTGLNAES
jgi:outer membrane protein